MYDFALKGDTWFISANYVCINHFVRVHLMSESTGRLLYLEAVVFPVSVLCGLQVLNAQRAGYKAAIVHNVDSDDLISMGSNDSKYRYHFFSPV